MSDLKTLKELFGERIYKIPDYQRGYIWDDQQLYDFWEDLLNINDTPYHYMGVLSLKENNNNEFEIIDGQQRLTTCIILLQSIIEFAEKNNFTRNNNKIIFSEYERDSIENITSKYLYENNIVTHKRHYKFQYICDRESSLYFNHIILNEPNAPELQKTLYTNKLENAKLFFEKKLNNLYNKENESEIKEVYSQLVNKLKFNEFIIEKDFDTNVAFESMNNRGKKLSTLELLKNRLLFLTTIISDNKNDINETKAAIVEAWAEIYKQLGKNRNYNKELLDDDFLKTHWIFYWGYSRQKGNDFAEFLLKKKFVRKNIYDSVKENKQIVESDYTEIDDDEIFNNDTNSNNLTLSVINHYVKSLEGSVCYWVDSFFPKTASRYRDKQDIVELLDKFNRINAGTHFRPLITVALQKYEECNLTKDLLIKLLQTIERFVFIVFALSHFRRNSYDAKFYNYSKDLYHGYNNVTVEKIIEDMNNILEHDCLASDGTIKADFMEYIQKEFENSDGYYTWDKIRYFLYEYEMSLTEDKIRNPRVTPEILLKDKDKTIEHVYPQTDTDDYWVKRFGNLCEKQKQYYKNAIGNLLLLSQPINSALQNDSFDEKKKTKLSEDGKITLRTGYNEGSYSEQEVAKEPEWNSQTIINRSKKLIEFMENHWNIKFNTYCKERLINPILALYPIED